MEFPELGIGTVRESAQQLGPALPLRRRTPRPDRRHLRGLDDDQHTRF
jgi:hypothetical protein